MKLSTKNLTETYVVDLKSLFSVCTFFVLKFEKMKQYNLKVIFELIKGSKNCTEFQPWYAGD